MTDARSASAWAGGSEVSLLYGLWLSSLVLSALALGWMAGLVIARMTREKDITRREADRRAVLNAFLAIMSGAGDATAQLSPYQRRACLIAEALLEAMALIRGPERERLIRALESLNIDDRLRSRMFTHDPVGRIASAEALSAFPSERTVEALHRVWRRGRDPALRLAAIRSLIELDQAPTFVGVLRELERRAADSLTFLPVLRLLAERHPEDALAAFQDRSLSVGALVMVASALASTGDYRALPLLIEGAADTRGEVRAACLRALGVLGHPAAEVALSAGMFDSEWEVRAAASEAAGRIGSTAVISDLVRRLEDPVWWVRFRAAESLALLGDKGVRSLQVAATAPVDIMRRAASLALAERGLA